jgi:hypothetical protein
MDKPADSYNKSIEAIMFGGISKIKDNDLIVVQSNDGKNFDIPFKYIRKYSPTLLDLLEDAVGNSDEIPLPSIDSKTLKNIISFMKYFYENPDIHKKEVPIVEPVVIPGLEIIEEKLTKYEQNFFEKMNNNERLSLINAANYLHFDLLRNVMVEWYGDFINNTDLSTEELAKLIGQIYGDMIITEEERAYIEKHKLKYDSEISKNDKEQDKKNQLVQKLINNENFERKFGWFK